MADKLKMQTENLADKNYEMLSKMFPNALTETITGYDDDGKPIVERAIDADVLRQEISCKVVEGKDERYQFTWPDKKKAMILSNMNSDVTLRPCKKSSVMFENTENIYIQGENLEVLKLLQETYLGKVKMIYIDPPYNTGHDFIYMDNFTINSDEYISISGQIDELGNRLFQNTDSNGRFHTEWLNMIYPRLRLAKNLLTDDGVIFISIDDNEIDNLKKVCNEVFGEANLVAEIPWQSRASIQNDTDFSINHEYICIYAKNRRQENRRLKESNATQWHIRDSFACKPLPLDKSKFDNSDNDPRGAWKADPFDAPGVRQNLTYIIKNPNTGEEFLPPKGRHWRMMENSYVKNLEDNRIVFGRDGNGRPQLKVFYEEKKEYGSVDNSWFSADRIGTSTAGTKELMSLFDGNVYFDTPKPTSMIYKLLQLANIHDNDIVLDFFSGSGTTAQAVMSFVQDTGIRCKWIMVQGLEEINEDAFAYKDGYRNICDIGMERIRRASKLYDNIDKGFRVLKLDSSNMKDVYYKPSETQQSLFYTYADNIKEDRTPEDLLFQVMLDLGVLLSSKIEETTIAGKQFYNVADGFLIACFDNDVTEEIVKAVAEKKPYYAVFRDSSMANDSVATNFDQIFASISPDTVRKVL